MAAITILEEPEVRDGNGIQDLRPLQSLYYNDAVDVIRRDEYPMLKGMVHNWHCFTLLTIRLRNHLLRPCWYYALREVSYRKVLEGHDGKPAG